MRTTAETRRVAAYTASTWTHQGQDVGRSHRRVGATASGSRVRDREDIRDASSPWICEWWCPDHAKRRSEPEGHPPGQPRVFVRPRGGGGPSSTLCSTM